MSVRAKMSCGYVERGARSVSLNFSAVFEGSEELQAVSENAIFGNATPSGWLNVLGPIEAEPFIAGEDYYIDLYDPERLREVPDAPIGTPALIQGGAAIAYRSAHNPNQPDRVQFKYGLLRPLTGMLDLTITNPAAIEWLDALDGVLGLVVRLARGRRSPAEIAAIDRMLATAQTEAATMWDEIKAGKHAYWAKDAEALTRDDWIALRTEPQRRKLAIAKGEII